jgi:hypothetical protein
MRYQLAKHPAQFLHTVEQGLPALGGAGDFETLERQVTA